MIWTNLFKRKPKQDLTRTNIYHPDFIDRIEIAKRENGTILQVNGIIYHRFNKETSMPWGRYMYLQTFLKSAELRMNLEDLTEYMKRLRKASTIQKGSINLEEIYKIISQIESRCELEFETETTYKLASVLYFDDTEDLYSYDLAYNQKKIAAWKEARTTDFFYMMPMEEFLNLNGSSPQDLLTFMDVQKKILEGLTSEMLAS